MAHRAGLTRADHRCSTASSRVTIRRARHLWLAAIAWSLAAPLAAQAGTAQSDVAYQAYRYFHENPELGLNEVKAADYIKAHLKRAGRFELVDVPALSTEVIAVLDSGRPGPVIALRADMDARKLDQGAVEPLTHDPRSHIDGSMHNCGHDAHSAMLLGAATKLAADPSRLHGKIVFVFQPAEEVKGGADDIVADGALRRLGVQAIFAQHAAPGLPVGTVTIGRGSTLAGSNSFTLKLTGKASHAAVPFEGADLAVVAARFVTELAGLPARGWDIANRPAVISVTKINTQSETLNATPGEVVVEGTIRAFEPLDKAPAGDPALGSLIRDRVQALATAYGIQAELSVRPGPPPTLNDPALFDAMVPRLGAAESVKVKPIDERGMFAEDFAFYTADMPALYFGLGIAKGELGRGVTHSTDFTIHPDALAAGETFLIALAETASEVLLAQP